MKTGDKIQRVTERGQITLPISWRRRYGSKNIIVKEHANKLEITPLLTEDEIEDAKDSAWVTIFDAVRDNRGNGIPAKELIATLRKSVSTKAAK